MRKLTLFLTLSFCSLLNYAQLLEEATPIALDQSGFMAKNIEVISLPAVNIDQLQKEDELNDKFKNKPWRFGENLEVSISPVTIGEWKKSENVLIWNYLIKAQGATTLNYFFDEFFLPKSAKLFIIDVKSREYLGAITSLNNSDLHNLSTWPFKGSEHLLQLEINASEVSQIKLHLKTVTHGYRSLKSADGLGDSDPCNINAICPDASAWPNQRKSALMITINGNGFCSGTLINNTLKNKRPFVLTAEHCGESAQNWAFRFNYQSSNCANNVYQGPNQSISGAVQRAHNGESDFSLLEMSSIPPQNYDVYYAGWDRSDNIPTMQFDFHHPSGDLKKISINNNYGIKSYFLDLGYGAKTWKIDAWDKGTTEGGSSGSGLYDQNGRIIGQLFGGEASCAQPGNSDYFGRLAISFKDVFCDSTKTLEYWLDPGHSGVSTLDGMSPSSSPGNIDIAVSGVSGVCGTLCGTTINPNVKVDNVGNDVINSFILTGTVDGNNVFTKNWSGALLGGASTQIALDPLVLTGGNHNLVIMATNPNGGSDADTRNNSFNKTITVYAQGMEHTMTVVLDRYGSENSWEILNQSNTVIVGDGPYTDDNIGAHISKKVCLEPGCYKLEFVDGYGDGMCCNFGDGSYTLIESRGDTLAEGWRTSTGPADVPITETTSFCISPNGINEHKGQLFSVYPNPGNGKVNLEFQDNNTHTVHILDLSGKLLLRTQVSNRKQLDLSLFSEGLYVLRIDFNGRPENVKLVITK